MYVRDVYIDRERLAPDSYVNNIPAFEGIDRIEFHRPVTFFAGENGSGKSTLLEAMATADGFCPEGGTRNYRFSTYGGRSGLDGALRLTRTVRAEWGYFLRAESFFNVATAEEKYSGGPGGTPMNYHHRSHGEGFAALAGETFNGRGIYYLDEPEAALSPRRQLSLMVTIDRCAKDGGQFFIATHSPLLLALPGAEILRFDDGPVHPCAYEETDSFAVMELFMKNRERMLHDMLDE